MTLVENKRVSNKYKVGGTVFNAIILSLFTAGINLNPIVVLKAGRDTDAVFIHEAIQHQNVDDISYGPQEYIIDLNECTYIHDINTLDTNMVNRILKFDSTGRFLYDIDKQSVPSYDDVWFGPITIDPTTNDLLILGSATSKQKENIPTDQNHCLVFRFSPKGYFQGTTEIECSRANFFLYNYNGHFFTRHVDGAAEFDNSLRYIGDIPKIKSKGHGYSQWTDWMMENSSSEYTVDDKNAGKFIIKLRNCENNDLLHCVFFFSPHYCFNGFVEGLDRHGNLFLNTFKNTYVRIHPTSFRAALVNISDLGIPRGQGDVRHAISISPNGNLYKAVLVMGNDNHLQYYIYRVDANMFNKVDAEFEAKSRG